MTKYLFPILAALALACDPSPVVDPVDPVSFRANPEVLYLSQYEADIDLQAFAKMVTSCDGIEKVKLAVTWTAYAPEGAGGPRVLGLGFSTKAHDPLIDCYEQLMLDMGAHP
jgi:hypothetical protein